MAEWPYNTTRWQRLRAAKLATDPLCEDCLQTGKVVAANTVDHRLAISQGGEPFPPLDELSSKCPPCHSRKTARGAEAGAIRTDKPMKGCGVDGLPLDSNHPWSN
jgi:5-methylcytosine-specific restriction protein A